MKNLFNSVKMLKPRKNVFDLTHDVKMSGKMGKLMPCLTMECVPGDKISIGSNVFSRFAPMYAPIMHRVDVYVHHFFVPHRILWDNWEKFITNKEAVAFPVISVDDGLTANQNRLLDYMGVPPPPTGATAESISAVPFSAYQCIYNEYYRDQNLIAEVDYKLQDGLNPVGELLDWRTRSWQHDYFTSALPTAQQGATVDIPLGEITLNQDWLTDGQTPGFDPGTGLARESGNVVQQTISGSVQTGIDTGLGTNAGAYDPDGSLEVDPTTINDLRRAFRLQEWLEKNMRGGQRYVEQIFSHFGVRSSDKRLQRPEYICGMKAPMTISEVVNTTGTQDAPQGAMAGHGLTVGQGQMKNYYCEEHGYIIGIVSVLPKTAYQQGIPPTFLKNDPLQFYWPSFAHIGEQEVKLKELYAYTSNGNNTFGYVPRYAEYKYMPSRVAGDFRTTLDFWHLGRIFGTEPQLNEEFVQCSEEETDRIFAVQGEDNIYIECLNKVKAVRPMPVYGTPMF